MYYTIESISPEQVRLGLASKHLNLGKHVFAFVFDNTKGAIKLIQDAGEQSVAWIPYEEIDHFDIITKSSSGSKGRFYDVIMHLKSFASWPLMQFSHLANAQTEMARLTAAVDLSRK